MGDAVWTDRAPGKRKPPVPDTPVPDVPILPPPPAASSRVIRITDERDGTILNRGYAYWPNAYISDGNATVFLGHADGTPRFFRVQLATGNVERLHNMVGYQGTTEGWYFTDDGRITLCDGPRLRSVDPFTGDDRVLFSISDTHHDCRLWQAHSSQDGTVHSATVERITSEGPYQRIGTVVCRRGMVHFYAADGVLDESQIDQSGRFLIIKEDDRNRVIDFALAGAETILADHEGALGHSDCGHGFMVGEDNIHGACVLRPLPLPSDPIELFQTWAMGGVSVRGGRCLRSDAEHLSLVALDGSGLTQLIAHGMASDGTYDTQVRASLDPTGQVACYLSNGGGRLDAFLVTL